VHGYGDAVFRIRGKTEMFQSSQQISRQLWIAEPTHARVRNLTKRTVFVSENWIELA